MMGSMTTTAPTESFEASFRQADRATFRVATTDLEYRKVATVTARKVRGSEIIDVETLEGPATANAGDYVVTACTQRGESWIVRGDVFEATYEIAFQPGDVIVTDGITMLRRFDGNWQADVRTAAYTQDRGIARRLLAGTATLVMRGGRVL
jgi:hypothetical protein